MKSMCKAMTAILGAAGLGMVLLPVAGAQCGSLGGAKAAPANWEGLRLGEAGQARLLTISDHDRDGDDAAIVGFWHVKLFSKGTDGVPDGTEIDAGYSQWHSDGTETLHSAGHIPLEDQNCEGVWKQIGHNRYKLNHVIMAWDSTGRTLVGPASFRETVTLSPDHNHYTANFVIITYDTSGNVTSQATGYSTAERVTVDSGPPTIF